MCVILAALLFCCQTIGSILSGAGEEKQQATAEFIDNMHMSMH